MISLAFRTVFLYTLFMVFGNVTATPLQNMRVYPLPKSPSSTVTSNVVASTSSSSTSSTSQIFLPTTISEFSTIRVTSIPTPVSVSVSKSSSCWDEGNEDEEEIFGLDDEDEDEDEEKAISDTQKFDIWCSKHVLCTRTVCIWMGIGLGFKMVEEDEGGTSSQSYPIPSLEQS
ncbi:hypothetical protein C8Q75DRAFT_810711 [Abortiporus biennis]|nr:hypothetical protein C8Q75DRAFT_810711 [Abortiporus biennis]